MNYQKIYSFDLANGKGIRISLFVSGCPFHCKGCFNSEAWGFQTGKPFTSEQYFKICELLKNPYYKGFSILGGEPFAQKDLFLLRDLCRVAHENGKDVWIWTGFNFEDLVCDEEKLDLLRECDILVDGRFIEEKKDLTLKWRGSSNQRIIDVQKSLKTGEIILYDN